MNKCVKCQSVLVGGVPFCPFCGQAVAGAVAPPPLPKPVAAVAAPAPAPAKAAPKPEPKVEPKVEPKPAVRVEPGPVPQPVSQPEPAPVPKPTPKVATPARPPAPPKKWPRWLAGIAVLALVIVYMNGKPGSKNESACNDAIDSGLKLVSNGSLDGARGKLATAKLACSGKSSAKADDLQAAIARAGAASSGCQRSVKAIESALDGKRLQTADAALGKLDADCAGASAVESLRKQLARQQAAAASVQVGVRQSLDSKDGPAAQNGIARLEAIDREYPELKQLKAELQALATPEPAPVSVPAAVSAPAPAPAPIETAPVRSVPKEPAPARVVERPAPAVDNGAALRNDMAQSFLRDAEKALLEGKFDAAKTYLDSARRIDPNNTRIESLSRRIRDRERQVLQTETTIK